MNNDRRALLRQLLESDTTSRESNLDQIHFIQEYLSDLNIDSQLILSADGKKANLYARLGPAGDGGVMLSGHTDVVPVDGQPWTVPPFQLTERDNRYYGRGSADMKGFIACVLASIPDVQKQTLRMPLHLAFSYDEEVGCLGVRSLIEYIQASPEKPAMCIIGEPTSMRPVYGHKGKVAMRCQIKGHPCHSAYAPSGVNAISYASRIIGKLETLRQDLEQVTDKRFDPPYSTLQVGTIQGGSALNIVPQHCEFDFELRYLPETNAKNSLITLQEYASETLLPEMRTTAEDCEINFTQLTEYPGLLTDPQSDFAHWLTEWTGSDEFSTVSFGTEGGLFDKAGIATLVCGPGSMTQGHKPDEFVSIDQLNQCSKMLNQLYHWMQL